MRYALRPRNLNRASAAAAKNATSMARITTELVTMTLLRALSQKWCLAKPSMKCCTVSGEGNHLGVASWMSPDGLNAVASIQYTGKMKKKMARAATPLASILPVGEGRLTARLPDAAFAALTAR